MILVPRSDVLLDPVRIGKPKLVGEDPGVVDAENDGFSGDRCEVLGVVTPFIHRHEHDTGIFGNILRVNDGALTIFVAFFFVALIFMAITLVHVLRLVVVVAIHVIFRFVGLIVGHDGCGGRDLLRGDRVAAVIGRGYLRAAATTCAGDEGNCKDDHKTLHQSVRRGH